MAAPEPPHPRLALQIFAGPASSGLPMQSSMGFALRPWPALFSRPRGHEDSNATI
jgi:hypothetical protein